MKKSANTFLYIVIVLTLVASTVFGQAPNTITYQGRLTDVTGAPIVVPQDVTFAIYSAPTGGTAMWTETMSVTPDVEGVFTVELGLINPLDETLFDGNKRYLGLTIGSDSEMSPRQWLTSVPYSISAGTVADSSIATEKIANLAVTTGKVADEAITSLKVADDGLGAVDLHDEPGLGFKMFLPPNTFHDIPDGSAALDSIKITVPDAGFVYVFGQAAIRVDHINGTADYFMFQVSEVPDTVIPNNFGVAMLALPEELPTPAVSSTPYVYPVDAHRAFQVDAAGEYTYYFNSWVVSGAGNADGFFDLQMTAMYFPTAYGTFSLSPPMPDSNQARVLNREDESAD